MSELSERYAQRFDSIFRELRKVLNGVDESALDRFACLLADSSPVFFAGAGRSGLMVRAFAMRLMHLGIEAHLVGDTLAPSIHQGDIIVMTSGSGETSSMITVAERAKEFGARMAVVTANPGSRLAEMADCVVELSGAGSVQPMGSLFEQSAFLFFEYMVLELMFRLGQDAGMMFQRHANLE